MARGSERKKGFSLLPVLIILASVLIGTGSVLVLREKMNEEQGTSFKEQEDIPTNQEIINRTNSNESNSLEQSNDETSAGSFTLKSSNEENTNDNTSHDETNSSKSQEIISKQIASSNDTNNGSIYLEADNDGKDELNLGKTLKIKGGEGIKTSLENNTITVTNTGNTNNTTDYSAGTGIDIRNNIISVADSYDDNFLLATTNFSGDITGTYNNLSVSDDSHSHTASTLPTNTSYLGQTISADEILSNTITRANLKDSNTPIDGQVLSYNQTTGGFTWITSSGSGTVTQINSGDGLSGGPITTTGTLGINAPTCSGTDKLQWNGTAFACSADIDTDTNTTYTAGTGLDLSGTTFSINSTYDDNFLTTGSNISLLTNNSGYITDGNTNWDNSYGFITDGNTNWDNSYGYITAASSDALTNKTGNISQWTNDSGYITDGNTNWNNSYGFITEGNDGWDNTYGFITDGNTGWDNSYGFITSVDFSQINNGSGVYLNYKPNNTACGLNQILKYDNVNSRWICGNDIDTDTDTDTNNYPTSIAFSGTTTKTLTLQRQGLSDLTATFTDIDTDTNTTYSAGTGISLVGTTFSVDAAYDDNFLTTSSSFSGDVSGTYNSIAVANDSHSHTASTLPSHDSLTGAGTIDTTLEVQGVSVSGDVSGTISSITVTDNSHSHDTSTISGIDISADTNLSGDTEIVLTGDALSLASGITRDTEWNTVSKIETATSSNILTSGENISLLVNDSAYITDGNTGWDNSYGFITASSSDALTNKTGNISMWTNDANFITLSSLSSSATGLTYTNTTGAFSLTTGYIIPTTTEQSNWNTAFGWGNHASQGYLTGSSSSALTNKTGNISMWTNDSGYITDGNTNWTNEYSLITLSSLSNTATGLTYSNTTGQTSLTSGYVIPTTTQETNWGTAYSKAHDQNTDTGTTQTTYQIDSDATGPKLKNNTQVLEVRNALDTDYANLKVKDLDIEGILQAGTSNIQLTDTTGKIQALSSTYFASLSGSNLTSLNASNISSGTIPSAQVSGSYTGITGVGTITTGTWSGTEIGVTKGGTGLTTISSGKLLYSSALNTLSELTLDTTLDISAGYLGVNETNILLSLLGGTLDDSQLPSGGDWTLTTNLNIDSNTLYINQSTNRIGIGTTNPNATLDVNGTVRAQTICDENGSNCRDLSDGWSNTSCPTGYIWVPGSAKQGTLPGFCVMKYEAKNDGSGNPVSTPTGSPWVSIYQTTAREECKSLGANYHLISDQEWMTIAENIAATTINDTDDDANPQFANGHSDNTPGSALATTSGADPVVSGCTTTQTMENAANAYSAGSCEIRGTGSGGSTDNDKGYYGTGQQWSATGYSAGAANKSQLRTHVLSNKQVIWDFPGNVWEWTNNHIYDSNGTAEMPLPANSSWNEYTAITNYKALSYARPEYTSWNSANGTGQIYTDSNCAYSSIEGNETCGVGDHYYHAFLRGGGWDGGAYAGLFTLSLAFSPSHSHTHFGFRCAVSP